MSPNRQWIVFGIVIFGLLPDTVPAQDAGPGSGRPVIELPPDPDPRFIQHLGSNLRAPACEPAGLVWSADGTKIYVTEPTFDRFSEWDAESGELQRWIGIRSGYDPVVVSPDGAACVGSVKNAKSHSFVGLWRIEDGESLWMLPDQLHFSGAVFLEEGKKVALFVSYAANSRGHAVKVVDVKTGDEVAEVPIPKGDDFSYFPRGFGAISERLLVCGFGDQPAVIVDIREKRVCTDEVLVGGDSLQGDFFRSSHDGNWFVAVSDQWLSVFQVENGKLKPRFTDSPEWVFSHQDFRGADFSPDGRTLFVGAEEKGRLYDLESGKLIRELDFAAAWPRFSPDGKTVAVAGDDRFSLISTETWEPVAPPKERFHHCPVRGIRYVEKEGRLLSFDCHEAILWKTDPDHRIHRILPARSEEFGLGAAAAHPDGKFVLGSDRHVVWRWVPDGPEAVKIEKVLGWKEETGPYRVGTSFDLNRSGTHLAVSHSRRMWVMELSKEGAKPREIELGRKASSDHLRTFRLSADGRRLFGATFKSVRVFDLDTETETARYPTLDDGDQVAFSGDEKWFVHKVLTQPKLILSDLETGAEELQLPLSGPPEFLARRQAGPIVFSSDSTLLAAVAFNDFTRWTGFYLWDVESGRELAVVRTYGGHIRDLAISPDNRRIAVSNHNATISIGDLEKIIENP